MPGSRQILLLLTVALVFWTAQGLRAGTKPPRLPDVVFHVDSVVATDTPQGGVDSRLGPMGPRLKGMFNYTSYRLVSEQDGEAECGKAASFMLPGGRILHVRPISFDGGMISMELILFQGPQPIIATDLKIVNNGQLIVGGPHYAQGILILTIGATAVPLSDRRAVSTAEASPRAEANQ